MAMVILLADVDRERGDVLTVFLKSLGFMVLRCSTAREVMEHLAARGPRAFMLLASAKLDDGELLPELEHWFCEQMHPLPRLLLWDSYGEVDLKNHAPFIDRMRALVFPLPLDIDFLLRIVRLFQDRPEALRPPSSVLSCPGVVRNGRLGRRCCVHATGCVRKRS